MENVSAKTKVIEQGPLERDINFVCWLPALIPSVDLIETLIYFGVLTYYCTF